MAGNIFTRTTNKIIGNSNKANITYDSNWKYTNDGINYFDIGSGGGGGASHTVIVDDYSELPTNSENGTYGFVRNSLIGVNYIFLNDEWVPVYNAVIGANKATLDIFSNDVGNVDKSIVEGSLKLQALDNESFCGVYNGISTSSQEITTSVNISIPPILDGSSFKILGGIFLRRSANSRVYSLMTGFDSDYRSRIITSIKWVYSEGAYHISGLPKVAVCPTFGNDFNMLKIQLYVNHLGILNFYRGLASNTIQSYFGGYLDLDYNISFASFLGGAPDQYGFCMYSTIENASVYFVNNYASDGNYYNDEPYTEFVKYPP